MPHNAGSFLWLVCLKLIWGKPTGFSRAPFPSSFSIIPDLIGTFPAVRGGLGLWFLLAFACFHSLHIFLTIYSVMRSTRKPSGLPYASDKQNLPLVPTRGVPLFPCPHHQQLPARAWRFVGVQAGKGHSWPAGLRSRVSPGGCWLAAKCNFWDNWAFRALLGLDHPTQLSSCSWAPSFWKLYLNGLDTVEGSSTP